MGFGRVEYIKGKVEGTIRGVSMIGWDRVGFLVTGNESQGLRVGSVWGWTNMGWFEVRFEERFMDLWYQIWGVLGSYFGKLGFMGWRFGWWLWFVFWEAVLSSTDEGWVSVTWDGKMEIDEGLDSALVMLVVLLGEDQVDGREIWAGWWIRDDENRVGCRENLSLE